MRVPASSSRLTSSTATSSQQILLSTTGNPNPPHLALRCMRLLGICTSTGTAGSRLYRGKGQRRSTVETHSHDHLDAPVAHDHLQLCPGKTNFSIRQETCPGRRLAARLPRLRDQVREVERVPSTALVIGPAPKKMA